MAQVREEDGPEGHFPPFETTSQENVEQSRVKSKDETDPVGKEGVALLPWSVSKNPMEIVDLTADSGSDHGNADDSDEDDEDEDEAEDEDEDEDEVSVVGATGDVQADDDDEVSVFSPNVVRRRV